MNILWFANTLCGAGEYLNSKTHKGGWLQSLESLLKNVDNTRLSVAFYLSEEEKPFEYKKVNYYPIYRKKEAALDRYIDRVSNKIEIEENLGRFEQVVAASKPDIIHIHGTELPFGLLNERIKNIPIVISIQGNFTIYSQFFFKGITKKDVQKYGEVKDLFLVKSQLYEYKKMKKRALLEARMLKRTKYIFGRTHWDHAISKILAPNSKYYQSEEVLRDIFYKENWDTNSFTKRKLFTTCSNNLYKGIEAAFETCIYFRSIGIEDIKWEIAGISNSSNIISICIKKYKVKPQEIGLKFLGPLTESEIVHRMRTSSIFVQTSHIENSPNSLCEAMMLGMPVITSAVGGTMSLLTHLEEGILYQNGDSMALAGCILNLLNQRNDYITGLSEKAKSRAKKRHDKKTIIEDLILNYNSIIEDYK